MSARKPAFRSSSVFTKSPVISARGKKWPRLERAGADLLESISLPHHEGRTGKELRSSFKILESVARSSNIPLESDQPDDGASGGCRQGWLTGASPHHRAQCSERNLHRCGKGGPSRAPAIGGYLIGRPFLPVSLARAVQILKSTDLPVFGVGGVLDGAMRCSTFFAAAPGGGGHSAYLEGIGSSRRSSGIATWMKKKGVFVDCGFQGQGARQDRPYRGTQEKRRSLPTPFHRKPLIVQD